MVYKLLREISKRNNCRYPLKACISRSIFLDRFKYSTSRRSLIGSRSSILFPHKSKYCRFTAVSSPFNDIMPALRADKLTKRSIAFSSISSSFNCNVLAIAARRNSSFINIGVLLSFPLLLSIIPQFR